MPYDPYVAFSVAIRGQRTAAKPTRLTVRPKGANYQ